MFYITPNYVQKGRDITMMISLDIILAYSSSIKSVNDAALLQKC